METTVASQIRIMMVVMKMMVMAMMVMTIVVMMMIVMAMMVMTMMVMVFVIYNVSSNVLHQVERNRLSDDNNCDNTHLYHAKAV